MTKLEIDSVSKKFGSLLAVDNITRTLHEDDIISIVGPNGAGKTTLFNLIKGTLTPNTGDILLDNQSLVGMRPDQTTKLGIVRSFQEARVFESMSIADHLVTAMNTTSDTSQSRSKRYIDRLSVSEEDRERALELLDMLDIDASPEQKAADLPYAERKLCSIAMTLATEPKILLLDEPVAGMNPAEREKMKGKINNIQQKFDSMVLIIEHDMDFVMDLSNRVLVINEGQVIADGKPQDVVENPTVIQAYLGKEDIGDKTHA